MLSLWGLFARGAAHCFRRSSSDVFGRRSDITTRCSEQSVAERRDAHFTREQRRQGQRQRREERTIRTFSFFFFLIDRRGIILFFLFENLEHILLSSFRVNFSISRREGNKRNQDRKKWQKKEKKTPEWSTIIFLRSSIGRCRTVTVIAHLDDTDGLYFMCFSHFHYFSVYFFFFFIYFCYGRWKKEKKGSARERKKSSTLEKRGNVSKRIYPRIIDWSLCGSMLVRRINPRQYSFENSVDFFSPLSVFLAETVDGVYLLNYLSQYISTELTPKTIKSHDSFVKLFVYFLIQRDWHRIIFSFLHGCFRWINHPPVHVFFKNRLA